MIKFLIFILQILFFGVTSGSALVKSEIYVDKDIQLIHLKDSIFVHVTWHHDNNYGRFPSNGMIIIRNGEALMVDTPIDNDKTERLTMFLRDSMAVELKGLIIGHFHDDCLGGLGYLQTLGVKSIANSRTVAKCRELELPVPSEQFTDSLVFEFNGEPIECQFLGGGHSFDNITVWIPASKILFGGCLVKSANSKGLGNLADEVVEDWDSTIQKIMSRYPDILTVVPGHGAIGGYELLTHTINLVKKEKEKQ